MIRLILFLPLIGFLVAGLTGRWIGHRGAEVITSMLLIISAVLSCIVFARVGFDGGGGVATGELILPWIRSGGFEADWTILLDPLTAVMLVVVTVVSALVHVYSIGYMRDDPHRARFFSYLSLFTFMMLMLVTADNFVQLFFGWEGVGLASYLLIGFWYKKPTANAAAIKAFIVNRIGDLGLLIGIAAIFFAFGSVHYQTVFSLAPGMVERQIAVAGFELPLITTICLLLFMGAMGKSAQFVLHTWLPDAMEGPTPVSALIHAATMVTAGVFLVARCSPLFTLSPDALAVVTVVGGITAFFAASIALVQNDIKRVIAWSTCSQLGYMFVAMGLGAWQVGMFHLFTHASFKALLFLGAGAVIHAMSGEQDLRRMSGLVKIMPGTYFIMLIGTLALTGFPFTAGYFSKDAIIEAAYVSGSAAHLFAFGATLLAAAMTAFYSWRLMFMAFHGESRASNDVLKHAHDSPPVMMIPLVVLAIGALFAGFVFKGIFIGDGIAAFWGESLAALPEDFIDSLHHAPMWVVFSPTAVMVIGAVAAWFFCLRRPDIARSMTRQHHLMHKFLLNRWYFDELYDLIFVRPALWIGRFLWKQGDGRIIDGLGPDGIAARARDIAAGSVRLQSGYLYHYAFAMLIGVTGLITWLILGAGPDSVIGGGP